MTDSLADAEILWDGRTVWVNGVSGNSLGRFGAMGIDVHTIDGTGCINCTHEPTTTVEQWDEFVADMAKHHGVAIPQEARPDRIAARLIPSPT